MDSYRPTPRERPRNRAWILLGLFLLSTTTITRTLAEMDSTAEKLGAIAVPIGLLVAGCWYAFKDGNRRAQVSASVLAMLVVGSFGFGVVRSLGQQRAAQEIGKELQVVRDGLAADAAENAQGPETALRHMQRTDDAVERMQASDNPKTKAFARVFESVTNLMRKPDMKLVAALEDVGSDRFMDVARMVRSNDFAWQRTTAQEYEAAAKGAVVSHARLPGVVEAELPYTGIDKRGAEQFLLGYKRAWQWSADAYEAHFQAAKSYGALIEFIEKNRAGIQVLEDGSVSIQEPEVEAAYDRLVERAMACEAELEAAVEVLNQASTKS